MSEAEELAALHEFPLHHINAGSGGTEMATIRLIKHEAVPGCGSFEVRFADGRPSRYFYFEDIPGRRLRPEQVDRATALERARAYAREKRAQLQP